MRADCDQVALAVLGELDDHVDGVADERRSSRSVDAELPEAGDRIVDFSRMTLRRVWGVVRPDPVSRSDEYRCDARDGDACAECLCELGGALEHVIGHPGKGAT